jgi:hypothetical protein
VPDRPAVGIAPRCATLCHEACAYSHPRPDTMDGVSIKSIFGRLPTPRARKSPASRRNMTNSPALCKRILHSREDEGPRQWSIDSISQCLGKARLKRIEAMAMVSQVKVSKQDCSTAGGMLRSCYLNQGTEYRRPLVSRLPHGAIANLRSASRIPQRDPVSRRICRNQVTACTRPDHRLSLRYHTTP